VERRITLVSGAPGAGKTTLAAELAVALGVPLLAKDLIKETLWDALEAPVGDLGWSRRLGAASMELLWALAERFPAVILEANFRLRSAYEQSRILALSPHVVEVYCWCPPEVAAARYAARAAGPTHHPAHVLPTLAPSLLEEFDRPVGVGTLIAVDTTTALDVAAIAQAVRRAWPSSAVAPGS
jgi:predicted kinase